MLSRFINLAKQTQKHTIQLARISTGSQTVSSTERVPLVTLVLRKDHYLFSGEMGKFRRDNLLKSYLAYQPISDWTRLTIPFFSTEHISLQNEIMTHSCNKMSDDTIQSCFALVINNEFNEQLTVSTTSENLPSLNRNSEHRCLIETHIIQPELSKNKRINICSFLRGQKGMWVPERTLTDNLYLTRENETYPAIPFEFHVDIATDKELGIDSEWDEITRWARNKA